VFGHAQRGISKVVALPEVWQQLDFALYTFHMPLFMFLAGYNVVESRKKPSFLARRSQAIIHPYVVWSTLQLLVMMATSGLTQTRPPWYEPLTILWQPPSPFWFLYVLFFFNVLVAFVRPSLGLFASACVLLLASPLFRPVLQFQFAYFLAFFLAGTLIRVGRLPLWSGLAALCVFGVGTFWALSTTLSYAHRAHPFYAPVLLPVTVAGVIATLTLAQRIGNPALLSFMGQRSMSIYVAHIIMTAGTRIVLLKAFHVTDGLTLIVLCTCMGVVGPLALDVLLRRARLSWYFGLGS
jgi:fucose 4-O-acetylase-like acetyltransferase